MSLIADPEVMNSILVWSHTFVEIEFSTVILLLPLFIRMVGVSYTQKYVFTPLSSLSKKSVVRLNDLPEMTIAVDWDAKPLNKSK